MKLRIITLSLFLAAFLFACENTCDSGGPREIEPTEFANLLFLNCAPEVELSEIGVVAGNRSVKHTFYRSSPPYEYSKIGSRVGQNKNTIRLFSHTGDDSTLIYNSSIDIEEDSSFTLIIFGLNDGIRTLFLNDNLKDISETNVYLRAANVSPDSPLFYISIFNDYFSKDFELKSGEASRIAALPTGEYTVKLTSADSSYMANYKKIEFQKGKINNLILRGFFQNGITNRFEVKLAAVKPPIAEEKD